MGDIEDDIQSKAAEAKENAPEQHLGDAMDEADSQVEGTNENAEAEKKRRLA